ncbi:MAG: prolyl oligopeptidase family serine peptidase [Lachnospiraceae bacterium]|nr:prolyl oligopeptidase family serine peptidase [Lachnospiraceae bacterium]
MRKRSKMKKRLICPALLLSMALIVTSCGSGAGNLGGNAGSGSGDENMPADWMDVSSEDHKEFTMIRVKDDYLELRKDGRNEFVYTEPEGSYPELEDGQCAKVVADVKIYDGGEAGYMGNIFIKDLKSCTPVTYQDLAGEYDFPDAASSNFDMNHYVLQYQNGEDLYLLFLNRQYVEAYREGEFFGEFDLEDCEGDRVEPFFEQLGEAGQDGSAGGDDPAADGAADQETEAEKPERNPLSPEDITDEGDGKFSCSFDGVGHEFLTYFPEETKGAPLVLMLHGFGESGEKMRFATKFEEEAVPKGYAVVYVTGAADPASGVTSTGWNNGQGAGENDDVGFLCALALYLQQTYETDPDRTFAVGFSNGAFMTHRLAVEAQDVFAAVVSVAGMCPEAIWEERKDTADVGFFQITGEKDNVVPKNSDGSAKHAKSPAIEDELDYWAAANGIAEKSEEACGKESTLTKYSGDGTKKQVWHLFIPGGRHSWPDEALTGVDANGLILEFLETQ